MVAPAVRVAFIRTDNIGCLHFGIQWPFQVVGNVSKLVRDNRKGS
ncbi:hypothetical protein N183_27075 [Sinorhizobium sp. Sb3]|nr:hypothetical protein N183_27075 [Sinorhizobium sp. Sb3]